MAVSINQISVQQIDDVLSFIEPYEAECVNLADEILNGAENCFVVQNDGAICGAFCFRARRTIFHCLPFTKYKTQQDKILCQETQAAFYEFFANEKPFCINGESTGSLFLKNILKNKPTPVMARVTNDYFLMKRGANSSCQVIDACSKPNIFQATADDAEKLFPLEKAYNYEEVIPPNFTVSDETLREALKLNLQKQKIFALSAPSTRQSRERRVNNFLAEPTAQHLTSNSSDNALVAKAAITAMGKNFALIGGVYTLPEYRRRGYARVLVQHILSDLGVYNAALYVKKKNVAAIALYKSLGFVEAGDYKLIYL